MLLLAICCNSFKTTVTAITAFGTIADDATKSGHALTVFHKKFSDIISDIQTSGLKNGLSGIFGSTEISLINDGDISRVSEYFSLIENGIDKNTALQSSLQGASKATKQIATASSSATEAQKIMENAVKKVTIAEKAATIGTKALSAALNAALVFGLTMAINGLIKVVDDYVTTAKEAEEAAKELRQSGHEAVESLNAESKILDNITQKYIELYTSTKDISSIKAELSDIQDELNDKYDAEAKGIDVVNGKLSEEIEQLRQLKYEQAEAFVYNRPPRKLTCARCCKILVIGKDDDEGGLTPSEEDNAAI